MNSDIRDSEWMTLYGSLKAVFAQFGTENAFGEGDYWLVDDDYGGMSHKLCIHNLAYLSSPLVAAVQSVLRSFPGWNVMVQLETELGGAPTPPEGIVIYSDHVEQHWNRAVFESVARALGI